MTRKIIIAILLILHAFYGKAQISTNVEDIFKMWMFLDKPNSNFRGMDSSAVKSDSLYRIYHDIHVLNMDTLAMSGTLSDLPRYMKLGFKFYRVDLFKMDINRELTHDEDQYLLNGSGVTSIFIIAIDESTGKSYRITGFEQSDFLGFLSDFKTAYQENSILPDKISTKDFLNNYKVEGVDFKCLNDGLRKSKREYYNYPCLKRCNDPLEIHRRLSKKELRRLKVKRFFGF